jgi:hypothetical protein
VKGGRGGGLALELSHHHSFDDRNHLIREEGVCSMIVHIGRISVDDGLHLNVEIAHHSVAMPSSHHPNAVQVTLTTNHGQGATITEGVDTDLRDRDARLDIVYRHGTPQAGHGILCFDGHMSNSAMVCCNQRCFFHHASGDV